MFVTMAFIFINVFWSLSGVRSNTLNINCRCFLLPPMIFDVNGWLCSADTRLHLRFHSWHLTIIWERDAKLSPCLINLASQFLTSALDGYEWSVSHPSRFIPRQSIRLVGGCMDFKPCIIHKNLLSLPEAEPPVQPGYCFYVKSYYSRIYILLRTCLTASLV
jgi:hypothetical protein